MNKISNYFNYFKNGKQLFSSLFLYSIFLTTICICRVEKFLYYYFFFFENDSFERSNCFYRRTKTKPLSFYRGNLNIKKWIKYRITSIILKMVNNYFLLYSIFLTTICICWVEKFFILYFLFYFLFYFYIIFFLRFFRKIKLLLS